MLVAATVPHNRWKCCKDVPAPEFFVYIDGSTATGAPAASQYASLGKPFHSVPGQSTQLFMDGVPFDVYLPPMAKSDVKQLSTTEDTKVGFGETAQAFLEKQFPNVNPELWKEVKVTFNPGSAQDDKGNKATQATIIPVDPQRLPAPLPPGVDPKLVISIQAGGANGFNREAQGGATNFDVPAPIQFPNLDGLKPGEKSLFWSFDHDAGKWVIIGTGTVSQDGKTIVSDPGVGVLAPGWHFTQPGTQQKEKAKDKDDCDNGDIAVARFKASILAGLLVRPISKTGESFFYHFLDKTGTAFNNPPGVIEELKNSSQFKDFEKQAKTYLETSLSQNQSGVISPLNRQGSFAFYPVLDNELFGAYGGTRGTSASFSNLATTEIDTDGDGEKDTLSYAADINYFMKDRFEIDRGDLWGDRLFGFLLYLQKCDGAKPFDTNVFFTIPVSGSVKISKSQNQKVPQLQNSSLLDLVENISANSSEIPISNASGFGSDSRLYYRYTLANGIQIAGRTLDDGSFSQILPPNSEYTLTVYSPRTNLHATVSERTNGSGAVSDNLLILTNFGGQDIDSDGIPDVGELAIGTNPNSKDSDGDGITDSSELDQGLDPLNGRGFPTGIIASLPLQGEAKAVVVEGSTTNAETQIAYLATGSYGLAIVDASKFNNPVVLGQLNLSGDATDVAVDTKLNIAAVATNSGGLQLINVSDGMLPTLTKTLNLSANQVEVADGIAYATVGNILHAIDLTTGEELQTLTIPGSGTVTGLAREGTILYAFMSGSDTFSAIDIAAEGAATVIGQINVSVASSDVGLSVGNGVAYLAGSGLRTIDVSNPNSPKLISDADQFFTARGVTLNGSGLALVSAEGQGLAVYSSTDPQKTDAFLTVIDTPGFAYDTAIASGIAFVADGTSGLQVINYLPFDNKGKAPTITLNTTAIDLDPNTAGIQVQEGSTIPLIADVSDDVQVRNVELLVNGQVVSNDVSFPWDLSVIAPKITADVKSIDLQVRATDTGGNIALSNILTLNLSEDKFAPKVLGTTPTKDSRRKEIPSVAIRFDEAIDTAKLNLSGVTLTNLGKDGVLGGGDDVVTPVSSLQTRNFDRTLVITPNNELPVGNYQLKIDPSIISDRAGNDLTDAVTLNFTKRPLTTPLTLGTAITGSIAEAGDDEVYTFSGVAGQRILFDKLDSTVNSIYAQVQTPSGISLGIYYYYNDSQPFTLTETGTYRITLKSSNNTTGDYSFQFLDANAAPIITLGTTVTNTLTPGLETDIYRINGVAGQRLFFDSLANASTATWTLYGPGNQYVTAANLSGDFETTLTSTGTYLLVLDGNNSTGNVSYSFKVTNPPTTSTALTLGTTFTSTISQPGEIDEYTFAGTAGQRLYYDGLINNNTSTVYAQLISPSGQQVFYNGDADSDRAPVTLTETGTYKLILDGYIDNTGDYSFRFIDANAAPTIALGTTVTNTLHPGLESDIYRINGTAGQRLFFDSLANVSSAFWTLYGPGNQYVTNANLSSNFEATLNNTGTYLLVIDGNNSNANLDYSFKVTDPPVTATALTLGNTVTSTISEPGELDEYTFTGTAGQRLYYDGLINNNTVTIYSRLISPSGQTVLFNSDADSDRTPVTLTETGTYKLILDGYFGDTGNYSFRLIDGSAAPTVTLGTTVTNTLNPGLETDIYRINGTSGQKLRFDSLITGFVNATWTLYTPANQYVTSAYLGSDFEVTLNSSGTYLLVLDGSLTNGTVNYSFNVTDISAASVAASGFNTIKTGTIAAGGQDTYTYTAPAGLLLYFDGQTSTANNIIVEARDADNQLVFSSYANSDTQLLRATKSGNYTLTVKGANAASTGNYRFQVIDIQAAATDLTLNTPVSKTLSNSLETLVYKFNGTVGQKLYYDALQSDADTVVAQLVSPGDSSIFNLNSDSNSGLVTLSESGTYYLLLKGNTATESNFNFRLIDTSTAPTIALNTTVTNTLTPGLESDIYRITGTAGQRLFFDSLTTDFVNAYMTLYGTGNQAIVGNYVSNDFEATLPGDGTYLLVIDGYNSNANVDYSFKVTNPPVTIAALTLGTTVSSTISQPGEVKEYTFTGTAGQRLYYDGLINNNTSTIYAQLISPSGQQVFYNGDADGDRAPFTILETGTYKLIFNGYSGNTGDYSFRLIDASAAPTIALDSTITSTLTPGLESDVYRITGTAGQQLRFDSLVNGFVNAYWTLYSPGNQYLTGTYLSNDFVSTLPSDGTYVLVLDGFIVDPMNYKFQVTNA